MGLCTRWGVPGIPLVDALYRERALGVSSARGAKTYNILLIVRIPCGHTHHNLNTDRGLVSSYLYEDRGPCGVRAPARAGRYHTSPPPCLKPSCFNILLMWSQTFQTPELPGYSSNIPDNYTICGGFVSHEPYAIYLDGVRAPGRAKRSLVTTYIYIE